MCMLHASIVFEGFLKSLFLILDEALLGTGRTIFCFSIQLVLRDQNERSTSFDLGITSFVGTDPSSATVESER